MLRSVSLSATCSGFGLGGGWGAGGGEGAGGRLLYWPSVGPCWGTYVVHSSWLPRLSSLHL